MSCPGSLGLPDSVRACLFDLDGVLTKTATVHMAAWKRTFDEFLRAHEPGQPEFSQLDYNRYVDGKPRADGVRDFLASRGITLPEGAPGDPPTPPPCRASPPARTSWCSQELEEHGVEVYPGSVDYLRAVKDAGLATAVVTASANGEQVDRRRRASPTSSTSGSTASSPPATGCAASRRRTPSWPAPGCSGSSPPRPSSSRTRISGVAAGRAGNFGYVVGVDRVGQADELAAHGADVVVQDLAELLEERS